jgi:hypothetical protein
MNLQGCLDVEHRLGHYSAMRRVLVALAMLCMAPSTAAQELKIPPITAPEPRVITEQGPSPLHYRKSPRIFIPTFRTGFGIQGRIATENVTAKVAFALDVYVGGTFRFGRGASTGLLTEVGYSYIGFSEHLASLGIGILHGIGPRPEKSSRSSSLGRPRFGIVPHAILGSAYGGFGVGARSSLILGYWVYGIEFAHQILFVGPRTFHEIHIVVGGVTPIGEDE